MYGDESFRYTCGKRSMNYVIMRYKYLVSFSYQYCVTALQPVVSFKLFFLHEWRYRSFGELVRCDIG